MNTLRPTVSVLLLVVALASGSLRGFAADSPELADARARLLEAFQSGQTDNDLNVKQLRAKISALEYVAAAKAATGSEGPQRSISIDFPGGPASLLVAALAKADRDNGFNVIGEKSDLAIELPAFSVRNADPAALAFALNGILQPRGYILATMGRMTPNQSPVFALRKLTPFEGDPRMTGQFQSFQLAPYLEYQSVDDIVGAIRVGWELDAARNSSALKLKFHPPTGILLVTAPPEGIALVHSVLKELRRADPNTRVPKSPPTPAEKR